MTSNLEQMFEEGCPKCGSTNTDWSVCSVNDVDNLDCVICDECGHTEYERIVQKKQVQTS